MQMSHSSFSEAYHVNCLNDYEKLRHCHKMDHYQTHIQPSPSTKPPHTATHHTHTTTSWFPKFHFPQPYDWHHPDPTVPAPPHHHFHFPAISTHDLASRTVEHINHLALPPPPLPTFCLHETPPWIPSADIRETKHAYHIEIELPGVTDKNSTVVQWLERGVLCVRGEIRRPDLHASVGGWTADAEKATNGEAKEGKEETDQTTSTPAAMTAPSSTESEWCALSSTHANDALPDGHPLERILSTKEQEAARESSTGTDASSSAPAFAAASASIHAPTVLLQERHVGLWQRTFTLPLDVDVKGLKATLQGGLLEIVLMKRVVDMGKCVTVEVR